MKAYISALLVGNILSIVFTLILKLKKKTLDIIRKKDTLDISKVSQKWIPHAEIFYIKVALHVIPDRRNSIFVYNLFYVTLMSVLIDTIIPQLPQRTQINDLWTDIRRTFSKLNQ